MENGSIFLNPAKTKAEEIFKKYNEDSKNLLRKAIIESIQYYNRKLIDCLSLNDILLLIKYYTENYSKTVRLNNMLNLLSNKVKEIESLSIINKTNIKDQLTKILLLYNNEDNLTVSEIGIIIQIIHILFPILNEKDQYNMINTLKNNKKIIKSYDFIKILLDLVKKDIMNNKYQYIHLLNHSIQNDYSNYIINFIIESNKNFVEFASNCLSDKCLPFIVKYSVLSLFYNIFSIINNCKVNNIIYLVEYLKPIISNIINNINNDIILKNNNNEKIILSISVSLLDKMVYISYLLQK